MGCESEINMDKTQYIVITEGKEWKFDNKGNQKHNREIQFKTG